MWADESIRHLRKEFRGLFLNGQRLSFPGLFMSQQGLCWLTNLFVTWESSFGGYFWVGSDSVFLDCLWVHRGCVGNKSIRHLRKQFRWIFCDWEATQVSLSAYESTGAVWPDESIHHLWKQFQGLSLSWQRLSFPWLFMSQQGLCELTIPFVTYERSFEGYLWVNRDSVFLDCLWVNRGFGGWRIHSSPVKAVSGAISERASTQFFVTVYESIGAV
jgi:hypothetical protein